MKTKKLSSREMKRKYGSSPKDLLSMLDSLENSEFPKLFNAELHNKKTVTISRSELQKELAVNMQALRDELSVETDTDYVSKHKKVVQPNVSFSSRI